MYMVMRFYKENFDAILIECLSMMAQKKCWHTLRNQDKQWVIKITHRLPCAKRLLCHSERYQYNLILRPNITKGFMQRKRGHSSIWHISQKMGGKPLLQDRGWDKESGFLSHAGGWDVDQDGGDSEVGYCVSRILWMHKSGRECYRLGNGFL